MTYPKVVLAVLMDESKFVIIHTSSVVRSHGSANLSKKEAYVR